ncbi:MAG: hypothetical protein JXR64_07355 [Spirochaetales bacterium]|nr:hypothetical protein [Spirochaetales bacterium]
MFNSKKANFYSRLKIALEAAKDELSIIGYASRYRVSLNEAREFKKWCRESYYYKSYKTESN